MALELKINGAAVDISAANKNVRSFKQKLSKKLADKAVALITDNILSGNLRLEPLSLDYKARKAPGSVTLVDTFTYVGGLRSKYVGDVGAGIEGDTTLMRRLEFGTPKMPPRPHVQPSLKQLSRELGVTLDWMVHELFRK